MLDVDGLLAANRRHLLAERRANRRRWPEYFAYLGEAQPVRGSLELVNAIVESGFEVTYSATRPNETRAGNSSVARRSRISDAEAPLRVPSA
jgi:hypothetical protein